MFPNDLLKKVSEAGVIAVLTVDDPVDAVPVARALAAGGVTAIELTLRTPSAVESLRRIRAEVPEMVIGAGTVLTRAQLEEVKSAGALFAVSPGCNPSTLRAAKELNIPFAPGVSSPSDIECAVEHGCRLLKFFPAETSGGLAHLKAMAAPFGHLKIRYIPLGGISLSSLPEYARSPLVAAVGGSWLATADVIKRKDWAAITSASAAAMKVVQDIARERSAPKTA
jgi:2-dehydro-3-deoxyphosphogluconate aldolase/(4S)-4-hydroxy-2-oxoglutarate aldolase